MIVRFETNIPQRMTLKFAEGREVEGQFGAQFLHALLPEGQVYLSPVAEDKLRELGVQNGDTVEICKREVKNGSGRAKTEWQVSKVGGAVAENEPPAPVFPERQSQDTPVPSKLGMDRAMTMFLIAAGRSTREAEQVLGAEGGSVRFDSRDVCALATTCMIQSFREGWIGWLEPRAAQALVAEAKIQQLTNQQETGARRQEFKPAASAWTTRGEMKEVFSRLREAVGEVEFAKELERAGVASASEFRYLNDARACYSRLVAIASKEVAA